MAGVTARNGNGTVAIPKWLLWVVGTLFTLAVGWAIRDRERIGETVGELDGRITREEAVEEATQADLARQRETVRAYIDARIREYHGGNEP